MFTIFYLSYLIALILAENSDSRMQSTIEEDEEMDVCQPENFNLPVSFSYDAVLMKNLTLNVDGSGLEKLDFCQELSDSLKEQLVIYTLFFERIIWYGYLTSSRVEYSINYILRVLEEKDQEHKFAKSYAPSVQQGTHKVLRQRLKKGYIIDTSFEMCTFSRVDNIINVAQKDLSDEKYKKTLEKIVDEYYKKQKWRKIFNTADWCNINLRKYVHRFFKWPMKVRPLGRRICISKRALDNLVDFFLFTLQDSIDKLPDFIFEFPEGLPLFLN